MNTTDFPPGLDLYNRVKAEFVARGTTLSAYCRSRGIHAGNARLALMGAWNGPKGRQVREELIEASGITRSPRIRAQASS